jgi:hypothetical protein
MEMKTLAHTPLSVSLIRKHRPTLLLTSLPLSLTISRHWRLEAPGNVHVALVPPSSGAVVMNSLDAPPMVTSSLDAPAASGGPDAPPVVTHGPEAPSAAPVARSIKEGVGSDDHG